MIDKAIRSLSKLKKKTTPVAASVFILFFFLYLPLIHSRLNANENERAAPVAALAAPVAPEPLTTTRTPPDLLGLPDLPKENAQKTTALRPRRSPLPGVSNKKAGPVAVKKAALRARVAPVARPAPSPLPPDITRGPLRSMEISITFDGGYEAYEADEILGALRARGIKTTVFLTGFFIKRHPDVTRQIVLDGHEVGNHTMTHPHLTTFAKDFRHRTLPGISRPFLLRELRRTEEIFKKVTGVEMAPLWRAPYGEINDTLRRWALKEGYLHVGWTYDHGSRESLDTLDWVHDTSSRFYHSSTEIKARILGFGKDSNGVRGGIILMHLGTERRIDRVSSILGEMLDDLTDMGYRFVKVSRLLKGHKALDTARGLKKRALGYKRLSRKSIDTEPS